MTDKVDLEVAVEQELRGFAASNLDMAYANLAELSRCTSPSTLLRKMTRVCSGPSLS